MEFALILPVFVLLLGGLIQFGIIFWGQNTLNQIVRDAGRYAATVTSCNSAAVTDITARTGEIAAASSFAGTLGTVTVMLPDTGSAATCPPTTNVDAVWVRIDAAGQVPVFFPFVPGNGAISSSARFRMEPTTP